MDVRITKDVKLNCNISWKMSLVYLKDAQDFNSCSQPENFMVNSTKNSENVFKHYYFINGLVTELLRLLRRFNI